MTLFKRLCFISLIGLSPCSIVVAQTEVHAATTRLSSQQQNIVAYFAERSNGNSLVKVPDPKGIYRILLSKTQDGYLVQDFFQDSHKPQSSPVLVKDVQDLERFQVETAVGEILLYNRNGQRFQKQVYDQQHNLSYLAGYSLNDKLLFESSINADTHLITSKIWHSNGALAFDLTTTNEQTIQDYKAWLRNGKPLEAPLCFMDRSINVEQIRLDPCALQLKDIMTKYEKLWEVQMQ